MPVGAVALLVIEEVRKDVSQLVLVLVAFLTLLLLDTHMLTRSLDPNFAVLSTLVLLDGVSLPQIMLSSLKSYTYY